MPGDSIYVYNFEYRDGTPSGWLRSPVPATMEAIVRHGWRALKGTGRLVFAELVNGDGVAYRA